MSTQTLEPGFMLVHGNRAEELCEIAVNWITENPLNPLEQETILVQSNGVAQWLRQQIAQTGIAAALNFILPSSFVWQAYHAVLGETQIPKKNPLEKNNIVWRLLKLFAANQWDDSALGNFLSDANFLKKYQLAVHLADLYDQYQVYRADWLNEWENNKDYILNNNGSVEIPSDYLWQANLWRCILHDIDNINGYSLGRAQIHQHFLDAISANSNSFIGLPRRILVFGVSSMPKQVLESLVALSKYIQVIVFINNPCQHYWGDIQTNREVLGQSFRRHQRKPGIPDVIDEDLMHNYVHPLLASWGKQGRDFISMLDGFDTPNRRNQSANLFARIEQKIDIFNELPGTSLLQQLQDDIRELRPLEETKALWPTVDPEQDNSISFHIAYSSQRELEVLRDNLLELFKNKPDLKPSDVIIMVPNITDYVPHIQSVFDAYDVTDNRYLPYVIADTGQRRVNPLVVAIENLLSLPESRLTSQQVLDLLNVPSLRSKFGIEESDLPLLKAWVEAVNIRWGLNQRHKANFINTDISDSNSWNFGLLRMLLGYATGKQVEPWQNIYPYPDTGGMQAQVLGGLANLINSLDEYWRLLKTEHTANDWLVILSQLLDSFFAPDNLQDEATLLRFKKVLQEWADICSEVGYDNKVTLEVVAQYCLEQMDQANLAHRFFAGAITFATLMPMRAIPFKHIFLLGMSDGDFPRIKNPDDFDLMAVYPRAGDRSKREDDRYLFLEALLSAREQLYVSWVGLNINDNTELPPSVLVAQLMDHIEQGWCHIDKSKSLLKDLCISHPLQPFSNKYFYKSDLDNHIDTVKENFTYANEWRVSNFNSSSNNPTELNLDSFTFTPKLSDLKSFLRNPVEFFYKYRFSVYFRTNNDAIKEDELYEVDGLDQWRIADKLLVNASQDLENTVEFENSNLQRLVGEGVLPSDYYGESIFTDVLSNLSQPLQTYRLLLEQYPRLPKENISIDKLIANQYRIFEPLRNLRMTEDGGLLKIVIQATNLVSGNSKNNYRFKHLVPAWVDHVAANVSGHQLTTIVLSPKGQVSFEPMEQYLAQQIWESLWLHWFTGIIRPLPVEAQTAGAWLRGKPSDAYIRAEKVYSEYLVNDMYMQRSYPSFESLYANGEFEEMANALYGDLNTGIISYSFK